MGKYRLVRMNEVRYTDDEYTLELLLDEGFVLEEIEPETEPTDGEDNVGDKEPETEPTNGEDNVGDKEPETEPTNGEDNGKKATKSNKK